MSHYKPNPLNSVNLSINGIPVTVPEGTSILEAARKVNVKIPTLCDHPDLCRRALCRLCVVECDGRAKLVAACANDVWEGVNIVTNNARLFAIRRTIVELILANHPDECLSCVRSTKCELQTLAADFGIRSLPFRREAGAFEKAIARRPVGTDGEALTRDMRKCVKCNRCVEVCQEVQTVRAINTAHRSVSYEICTPYGQALSGGPCIFCGQCAAVCPVGAIYGRDQSAAVRSALTDKERAVFASLFPSTARALCAELCLPPGSVTSGKIANVLGLLGFSGVFNAALFADMTIAAEKAELSRRIKTKTALPMLSSCLPGFRKFVKESYPDLEHHLSSAKSPEQNFTAYVEADNIRNQLTDKSRMTFVSLAPCIAKKFKAEAQDANDHQNDEIALSPGELAGLIRLAGIDISALPESGFTRNGVYSAAGNPPAPDIDAAFGKVYEAYYDTPAPAGEASSAKTLIVNGLADARIVMESIRKGECDAVFVGVMGCAIGGACSACGSGAEK